MQTSFEHNAADPFGEFGAGVLRREIAVLGARFEFRSRSAALMELVNEAYGGLPGQCFDEHRGAFRVELNLVDDDTLALRDEPPVPQMRGGAGLLGAAMDESNLVFVSPGAGSASVHVSRGLLGRHRYNARYELLEFAVFTLASRALGLAPLHAACVGQGGRAALLIGDSGAGKTTLAQQALIDGMEFLTEDASFIEPLSMRAIGVANFLHPRFDALRFVEPAARREQFAAALLIRRRSGVVKHEVDLRSSGGTLVAAPPALAALVFLSPEPAEGDSPLRPLDTATAMARLRASQPYAAQLPTWPSFERNAALLPAVELRRGAHPREGVAALRDLLDRA